MVYRGVYRDGVIVPEELLSLPEGSRVDFDILGAGSKAKKKAAPRPSPGVAKTKRRASTSAARVEAFMQAFGVMSGRPEWKGKSSAAIARELRTRALGDRFGG